MHKYRLCSLSLEVLIRPNGPILVKSPYQGTVDPAIPDMSFVRTRSPVQNHPGMTVYLPGSSIKGVLRSYCEGIGRALGLQPTVCDPFNPKSRCRKEPDPQNPIKVPQCYQESCHICRLFGSTRLAGRIAISDAYPVEDAFAEVNATSQRTGVGIDRLLGSSHSGSLYDFEVVERGAFLVRIKIENFELWQIGLIALALRDLNDGSLRIGLGTSRGMGFVKAEVQAAELRYTGLLIDRSTGPHLQNRNSTPFPFKDDSKYLLYGVAHLMGNEATDYGMRTNTGTAKIPLDADRISDMGIEIRLLLKSVEFPNGEPLQQFFAACVEKLRLERQEYETAPAISSGG